MSGQKPREIAGQVLNRVEAQGQAPGEGFIESPLVERLLEAALGRAGMSAADRHLCQELVYGVVRWRATLDWLIERKTDAGSLKPRLRTLLRLGLYQIFWLDRIPPHAAVHETVELAKSGGFKAQSGFINAVLRGYLREHESTRHELAQLRTQQPEVGFSHPAWLISRWQQRWDAGSLLRLLEWNNTPPKTFARVNLLKVDPGRLLARWREEGVEYDFVRRDWFEENLVFEFKSHPPLRQLPSFQQGDFYVQDPSTLLAVQALAPRPGEAVLDLCAAPGGKLTYIAQLMQNAGTLVAHDVSQERLKLIEENCTRLGIKYFPILSGRDSVLARTQAPVLTPLALPVETSNLQAPAFNLQSSSFDRILIDAPCSNTGVMRRRVDLRWRIRPDEIQRLRGLQLDLLRHAAPLLKRGGTIVYSTCSLEPEENGEVVRQFVREQNQFKLDFERELLPFRDQVDGAYVARLQRG